MTLQHPHAELSAYIDGALAPAAQAAVEGHVAACAVCRAHVAELRATVALVHALPDPVPSRRLVPRFATVPAWLAPLRTVMTLASGTAVFLFIASSLMSNITFLASGGAATTALEASRDTTTNFQVQVPTGAQSGSTPPNRALTAPTGSAGAAPAPIASASPVAAAADAAAAPSPDDAAKVLERSAAGASAAPGVGAPQDRGRFAASEPQRSPLLNPWLWLTLAFLCGAIAIALQRRLRSSV